MKQIEKMRDSIRMADAMMRKSIESGDFEMAMVYAKYAADIEQALVNAKVGY